MMRRRFAALIVSAGPLLVASCGESALGPSTVQGEWRLVSLTRADQSTVVIPDPSRFTARFDEGGRAALRADCNTCNGSWSLADGTLAAGPFACTRAFCSSAPLDTQFAGILEGRSTARGTDARLVLASERGRLVFER